MDLIDPRREVVEVAAQGVQTVYVVEPVFVGATGPTMQEFEALAAEVAALTARVEELEAGSGSSLYPSASLYPSPTLYPRTG